MTIRTGFIGAAIVVLLFLGGWLRDPANAQPEPVPAAQKWEYRIVVPDDPLDPRGNATQFNRLGAEGWELCVSHIDTRPAYSVFKRPR